MRRRELSSGTGQAHALETRTRRTVASVSGGRAQRPRQPRGRLRTLSVTSSWVTCCRASNLATRLLNVSITSCRRKRVTLSRRPPARRGYRSLSVRVPRSAKPEPGKGRHEREHGMLWAQLEDLPLPSVQGCQSGFTHLLLLSSPRPSHWPLLTRSPCAVLTRISLALS